MEDFPPLLNMLQPTYLSILRGWSFYQKRDLPMTFEISQVNIPTPNSPILHVSVISEVGLATEIGNIRQYKTVVYTRHLFTTPKYKISTRIWPTYILSTQTSLPWFKAGVGGGWGSVFVQRLPGYICTSYKFLSLYSRFAHVQFTYALGRFVESCCQPILYMQ